MTETHCQHLIVGGGPAGLSQAYWTLQQQPDAELRVLEASGRPGGWVHTYNKDGFAMELGPQALRPSDTLDAVVESLGMDDKVVPATAAATARWIGRKGDLIALPSGPGSFFGSQMMPFRSKLRVFAEPFVGRPSPAVPDESVASFIGRRFGKKTVPLVHAMVSGIFAGDADALEMCSAFPMMTELEACYGSVVKGFIKRAKAAKAARNGAPRKKRPPLISFAGGLSTLTDTLAGVLGERVELGQTAIKVERSDDRWVVETEAGDRFSGERLTIASPAHHSARMLKELDPAISKDLAGIPFASLASVYLSVDAAATAANERCHGFGFLLEPGEQSPVLGCLYASTLFPQAAPAGKSLIRVMMGGVRHPNLVDRGDDALIQLAETTLRRYTGLEAPLRTVHVERVRDAVPQFVKGHADRLQRIQSRIAERWPGLDLRGNSYRAVAMTGQLGKPDDAPAGV